MRDGGLFRKIEAPPLTPLYVAALRNAAALDGSALDLVVLRPAPALNRGRTKH